MQTMSPGKKISASAPRAAGPIVTVLLGFAVCCAPDPAVMQLQSEFQEFRRKTQEDLAAQQKAHEADVERLWGKLNCSSELVRDFVRRCEEKDGPGCSEEAVAGAPKFMHSQPHTLVNLRPRDGISSLVSFRRGQLLDLLDTNNLYPTTRFVILVQPRGEGPKLLEEAELLGNQMLQYLRVELALPRKFPIYGPHLLPCKLKADVMTNYSGKIDRTQPGEPLEGQPRVRVWVFRTDCGGA